MFRAICLVMLVGSLTLVSVAGEAPAVREIGLTGLKRGFPRGKIDQPNEIKNAEDLAKSFPEEDWQSKLAKHVDFAKDKLVFFAWSGSGQDKITVAIDKGDKQASVSFQYQRGLTRDLRSHFKLYLLPKDATWKVVTKE